MFVLFKGGVDNGDAAWVNYVSFTVYTILLWTSSKSALAAMYIESN